MAQGFFTGFIGFILQANNTFFGLGGDNSGFTRSAIKGTCGHGILCFVRFTGLVFGLGKVGVFATQGCGIFFTIGGMGGTVLIRFYRVTHVGPTILWGFVNNFFVFVVTIRGTKTFCYRFASVTLYCVVTFFVGGTCFPWVTYLTCYTSLVCVFGARVRASQSC